MLANALFYVMLIALASSAFLTAGAYMSRATIERLAQAAVAPAYQRAVSVLQHAIAAGMQNSNQPQPLPSFTPLPAKCVDPACTYKARATIAVQAAPTPASCDASSANCAQNEEANAYVEEGRVAARITVTVVSAGGETLAVRSQDAIFRTFAVPPYAAIIGARDGSFDGLASLRTAGDDGGTLPATPDPCGTPGADGNTAVRVAYRNAVTSACTDGSSWRDGAYSAAANSNSWSP